MVYRSPDLYEGQLRGVRHDLSKRVAQLDALNQRLANPRSKTRTRTELSAVVTRLLKGPFLEGLIHWQIHEEGATYRVEYQTDAAAFQRLQERLGLRILMTDRHEWTDDQIVAAYHGQAKVEYGFRNLKNPYHIGIRPQFHWTDQKLKVHVFTCVLGLLMVSTLHRQARQAGYPATNYDNFLDRLNGIRLAVLLEQAGQRGRPKAVYQLEETEALDELLLDALGIRDFHQSRPRIGGIGVYSE